MQTETQFQDGMSRERFWQEVALRFAQMGFQSLFNKILESPKEITEEDVQHSLKVTARWAFDAADEMSERHGPDNLPRIGRGVK